MMYCDLHNHSIFSDGSFTPLELVKYAKEKGLSAVALTDHNTVTGIDEFYKALDNVGIEGVFGTELTTEHNGKETHLLALFVNKDNMGGIFEFTEERKRLKRQSNIELAEALNKGGYKVNLAEMEKKYRNINRAHFARDGYIPVEIKIFDEDGNTIEMPITRTSRQDACAVLKKSGIKEEFIGFDAVFHAAGRKKYAIRFSTGKCQKEIWLTGVDN